MEKGYVQVFCGSGEGKSSAALGKGLIFASEGKNVIIVQFMKEKSENEERFFQRLEPEIKMFRFEKKMTCFSELSDEEKKEEITNIKNGLNYAKKVLTTGECDLLILDEVLGLIDEGVIDCSELIPVLASKSDNVNVLLTGIVLPDELKEYVDHISNIESLH
ncbi:MAG: cob(I)yrinic acid a,c-diamide adenosyltransferase [Lachnospiraceae bacterium]|nr:cob(I)yrinic acid a,c-diamide adenosyltransferase [Lachnospiraceae bacterium]